MKRFFSFSKRSVSYSVCTAVFKGLERAVNHSPSCGGGIKNESIGTSSSLKYLHVLKRGKFIITFTARFVGIFIFYPYTVEL